MKKKVQSTKNILVNQEEGKLKKRKKKKKKKKRII